ncbi:unnamed protein product [Triticum turgidum subsp. durum]|uniref:Glucan endo-1,3-beta-D-glucosidase n=1 Tax=Triticum turgidum subsp. durum TaxID=4567 RepID=A0A9R0QF42_TRITD|nr:unnamed protein product [Triticum turgidum subsp. durum]
MYHGGPGMSPAAAGGRGGTARKVAPWILACGFLLCSSVLFLGAEGAIGVNYGMIANNLPTPDKVIAMYKANKISYVRLFHPDTTVLTALRGTGIGVVLGTLNEDLAHLASDESFAASWVASYVKPFAGAVTFRYITAGNEVIPGDLGTHVLLAIRNIETALKAAGVTGVPVTTAVETYLFAMFNENQKPEGTEQHFGLFQPDMSAVYPVDFAAGAY